MLDFGYFNGSGLYHKLYRGYVLVFLRNKGYCPSSIIGQRIQHVAQIVQIVGEGAVYLVGLAAKLGGSVFEFSCSVKQLRRTVIQFSCSIFKLRSSVCELLGACFKLCQKAMCGEISQKKSHCSQYAA